MEAGNDIEILLGEVLMEQDEYLERMVFEALEVTSRIEDPNLRSIAFGEVLRHLLGRGLSPKSVTDKGDSDASKEFPAGGPTALLDELVKDGFFTEPRSTEDVIDALGERGHFLKHSDLTYPLSNFVKKKLLRRQKREPPDGGQAVWFYSNW